VLLVAPLQVGEDLADGTVLDAQESTAREWIARGWAVPVAEDPPPAPAPEPSPEPESAPELPQEPEAIPEPPTDPAPPMDEAAA
jgi:hypothetical protein